MRYQKDTQFTASEREAIRTMLHHAQMDMEYGSAGSYVNFEQDDEVDKKEYKRGEKGLALIRKLLYRMEEYNNN